MGLLFSMADSKFILYVRKFLKNPLLGRKQLSIDLIHPEMANVSKKDITDKLVKTMKADEKCISIFGMKTKFGGGRSTGFALIYDSADAKAQYDSKTLLRRYKLIVKPKTGRKAKKEIKGRQAKVKGIKKAKCTAGKQKK